jgi:hypothetical protein
MLQLHCGKEVRIPDGSLLLETGSRSQQSPTRSKLQPTLSLRSSSCYVYQKATGGDWIKHPFHAGNRTSGIKVSCVLKHLHLVLVRLLR